MAKVKIIRSKVKSRPVSQQKPKAINTPVARAVRAGKLTSGGN